MSKGTNKGYHGPPKPLTDAEKRALTGLDLERGRRATGLGRIGCMFKLLIACAIVALPVVAILVIRPWNTVSEQIPIESDLCTEGERAMQFRETLFVFGVEVQQKNRGTVCVSDDD